MSLPEYIIISDSEDESIFEDNYIDIPVDPASIPTPMTTAIATVPMDIDPMEEEEPEEEVEESSDEEIEEEDPEEEDPEEESEESEDEEPEEAAPVPTDFYANLYPNRGPRTLRTARKRVHLPQTEIASTSTAAPIIHSPSPTPLSAPSSPSSESSLPPYFPTEILESPVSPYANISLPTSPFYPTAAASMPTSPAETPYTPLEPYAPVTSPGMTNAEYLVHTHQQSLGHQTTSPHPPITEEQIIPAIIHQADLHDIRIEYLEHIVESLSGPAHVDMIEGEVMHLNHRVHNLDQRTQELTARVLTPGAYSDRLSMIEFRMSEIERQLGTVLAEMRSLHEITGTMLRRGN